jgi:hypothetical protein
MTIPEGAPEAIFDYDWTFEVDGREKVVTTKGDYPKVEGKFIGVETREVQAGYEPPIHDFTMERGGEDHTQKFLAMDNLILVIAYSISNAEMQGFIPVKQVTDQAIRMGYNVIGLSASSPEVTRELAADYGLNFDFYFCDMTTLKTIVRSNPGILELQKGTIMQKLHWNDVDKLQLQELETALPDLDFNLKRSLDSIAKLDQMYRELMYTEAGEKRITKAAEMGLDPTLDYSVDGMWSRQMAIDKSNMALVSGLFDSLGYPGKSVVGEGTAKAAWYVLQHNPERIPDYIDLIRKAGSEGELPLRLVAMMEDRYLTNQNMPQLYGTQGMTYDDARGSFIWPVQDPENVNQRRREVGFTQTVEESAKDLFGPDFEYKVLTMDDIREQN